MSRKVFACYTFAIKCCKISRFSVKIPEIFALVLNDHGPLFIASIATNLLFQIFRKVRDLSIFPKHLPAVEGIYVLANINNSPVTP